MRAARAVTRDNPLHLRRLAREWPVGRRAGGGSRACHRRSGRPTRRRRAPPTRGRGPARKRGADCVDCELAGDDRRRGTALARAADLGLVTLDGEHARVVHDAVREAAVAMLPRADRMALHARAAARLVGSAPDVVARRAHHAIEAALASTDAAARAVVKLREAAALLGRTSGFETAAALLARASEIHAAASPAAPSAALAVEHAEAVRLRPPHRRSGSLPARRAERGAGGRCAGAGPGSARARRDVDQRAPPRLGGRRGAGAPAAGARRPAAGDTGPARKAGGAAAAEASYRGSSIAPVLAALKDVRATGDARALAEVLSLAHHGLLTPEHVGGASSSPSS